MRLPQSVFFHLFWGVVLPLFLTVPITCFCSFFDSLNGNFRAVIFDNLRQCFWAFFCPPLSLFWSGGEGPEEDVVRVAKCDIIRKKCKLYIFIKIFFLRNGKKVYFCGDIGMCFFCGRLDGIGAERKTGRETVRKKNKQININLKFFEL